MYHEIIQMKLYEEALDFMFFTIYESENFI